MPQISIIVPAYNAQKYLGRCIDSILAQDFQDFELIVVDDGSHDSTPEIVSDYAAHDARVRLISQENAGVSCARNTALDAAQGDYIQFLDADDWISPEACRLMVRALQEHDADMVICDFYRVVGSRVAPKGDIDLDRTLTREEYADFMMRNPADFYYGVLWNKLYRRSIIEAHHLRMDPDISWSEDFIFNMEYVLRCRAIYPLTVPLYYYVKTAHSLVSQGTLASTVQMKLNVIQYYRDFYKQVYDKDEYAVRRPEIYAFLLQFAGDGSVAPYLPSTKQLGKERLTVHVDQSMAESALADVFFADKLLDRFLTTVAQQFELALSDVRACAFVLVTSGCTRGELAEYLGLSNVLLSAQLSKLSLKGYLETTTQPGPATVNLMSGTDAAREPRRIVHVEMGQKSGALQEAIRAALEDYDQARFSGLDEKNVELWRAISRKIAANERAILAR
ncbi:MAG: glycosyltransferase [Atopobiaceae bacterium]|jgi:glycosyltransferase involved in cell wall biosynthesis/DNA-binding MarR family transcriptional regulator